MKLPRRMQEHEGDGESDADQGEDKERKSVGRSRAFHERCRKLRTRGTEVQLRIGIEAQGHGTGSAEDRFLEWVEVVAALPRKQTRVLTWPVVTVFGFVAKPRMHIFLKPLVTKRAAEAYGFDFNYALRPNWLTYRSLLTLAKRVRTDAADLGPRDMIDIQSFLWVQGSAEYD